MGCFLLSSPRKDMLSSVMNDEETRRVGKNSVYSVRGHTSSICVKKAVHDPVKQLIRGNSAINEAWRS